MPDIRDVLKGLSADDRALYAEVRTTMRRAYLAAHAAKLPIEQFTMEDDAFLDLLDIKVATLFDRAGVFNHSEGSLDTETAKVLTSDVESAASKMIKTPLQQNSGWGKQ